MRSFISVLLLTLHLGLFGQEPANLPEKGICAHRGATENHPENTIPAFEEASRLGAQMIEFDVQLTKDGYLVVIHDDTVDRTTNGSGLVESMTLADIKKLDACSWKSEKFKETRIPTLKEALQVMPTNVWLNVHLKGRQELGKKVAEQIIESGRQFQAIIACGKKAARGVMSVDSTLRICNMERTSSRKIYVQETIQMGYGHIQLKKSREHEQLSKDVKDLKSNGVSINYFDANTVEEMRFLFASGIDFILTDKLALLLEAYSMEETSK